ncbi:MAG: hypothetical protein U5K30_03780 [Acidimicrobiales bacterium]|nr:hypothetical protein [Acidimicrobiales bacterium]
MGSTEPIEGLFEQWYAPLVRALAVAFDDAEGAADAVQEAFIEADRRWKKVGRYDEPAAWIRRVAALYKSPPGADLTTTQPFWVDHNPSFDPRQFRAAIRPDVPVVFFAEYVERDSGTILMPSIEGFVTACADGPLLGYTGTQGDWPSIENLDQLHARLEELAGS